MRGAPIALLAIFPAVLYASAVAANEVGVWSLAGALGVAAALLPAAGIARRDLAVLVWLPGLFLGAVLFLTSGISVNALPGPLGDLTGGWAVGAPAFAAIGAVAVGGARGRRVFLLSVALLAALAVLAVSASTGGAGLAAFAESFAQVPRLQAETIATILTGGSTAGAPFLSAPLLPFDALALLAGAGGLASLLAVDVDEALEGLGHEGPNADVPEGKYRSLLIEGRSRLAEAAPSQVPVAADPGAFLSLVAGAALGAGALVAATVAPDWLLLGTIVAVIVLLGTVLFSLRFPRRRRVRPVGGEPRAPAAGRAERF